MGGSVMSVLCMSQGRTQPGHTAGEHLGLYSARSHGWWMSRSVPFVYVGLSSGLCVTQWSSACTSLCAESPQTAAHTQRACPRLPHAQADRATVSGWRDCVYH